MRTYVRASTRSSVHPSVRPSIRPSIRPSVHPYVRFVFLLMAERTSFKGISEHQYWPFFEGEGEGTGWIGMCYVCRVLLGDGCNIIEVFNQRGLDLFNVNMVHSSFCMRHYGTV